MNKIIIIFFMFLYFSGRAQSISADTIQYTPIFKSLEEVLEYSEIINDETFDLKFLLRVLPDNGWFLKLKKNSSYEYIHWSGWGEPEGTVLETGQYSIKNNRLTLKSDSEKSELFSSIFYLVTSGTNEVDNNLNIDCEEYASKIYCLYKK